jgi:hypothetical protein
LISPHGLSPGSGAAAIETRPEATDRIKGKKEEKGKRNATRGMGFATDPEVNDRSTAFSGQSVPFAPAHCSLCAFLVAAGHRIGKCAIELMKFPKIPIITKTQPKFSEFF